MGRIYKAYIVTVSDSSAAGTRDDVSGQVINDILLENNFEIVGRAIVPDEIPDIQKSILDGEKLGANLILTTGGTGFSKRDNTPEATRLVIEREAQGIAEAIRYYSLSITPRAMLSRGIAGIKGDSLIVNLPGSPKAVKEALDYILGSLVHGLDILLGEAHDCARK